MLEVRNLSVAYGNHQALAGVSVKVDKGEVVVILGANGAGKSTLLRAIGGLCEGRAEGEILLDRQPIVGLPAHKIVESGIALVPEGRGIFPDLTVRENLLLGAYTEHARTRQSDNMARVHELFPKLRARHSQVVRTMSGGEQQMVAIGRAIMSAPDILMLDEPSLGLAPLLCKELFQSLSHIRDSGMGVLLVEQNAKQSLAIADRGYLLENGHITGQDTAQKLIGDPSVQKAYLGGAAGTATGAHVSDSRPTDAPAPAGREQPAPQQPAAAYRPTPPVPPMPPLQASGLGDEELRAMIDRAAASQSRPVPPRPATPPRQAGALKGDRDLRNMLADMEAAAARALNGARKPPAAGHDTTSDDPETPPVIEVYRRPKLEIFRRSKNKSKKYVGLLKPVKGGKDG